MTASISYAGKVSPIVVYNISTHGFGIFADRSIPAGTEVLVTIPVVSPPLQFKCRVVFTQQAPFKGRIIREGNDPAFQCGLEVIFQSDAEKDALANLHLQLYE